MTMLEESARTRDAIISCVIGRHLTLDDARTIAKYILCAIEPQKIEEFKLGLQEGE